MTNKTSIAEIQLHKIELDAILFALQPAMDEIETKGKTALFPKHLQKEFQIAFMIAVSKIVTASNNLENL